MNAWIVSKCSYDIPDQTAWIYGLIAGRTFEPQHQKTYLREFASSEDKDQPAHSRRESDSSLYALWIVNDAFFFMRTTKTGQTMR